MSRKRTHHGNTRRGTGRRPAKPRATIHGTVHVSHGGQASLETAEGQFRIAPRGLREAMHGDEVQASITSGPGGEKLAVVQAVLVRATVTYLGRYEDAGPLGVVVPLDARVSHDLYVLPEDKSAERLGVRPGDVVSARIVEYPARKSAGVVTIERRVGSPEELDIAIEQVIASHGLATEFPPSALAQAADIRVDAAGALARDPRRRDLRDLVCATVDPTDARDFDDAVGVRRRDDGGFELWVHIADVTHYVELDSPIDNEAKRRTCSVYLADRVIPMLPEELSNDACSLRPDEDRLAMSVRVMLDERGRVVKAKAMRSVIRSRARLDYDTVDRLLDGADVPVSAEVAELLRTLDDLRALREQVRRSRGAVDFETVETKVVLDDSGTPIGVSVRRRTRATGLIEEAMLVANECVAKMLADSAVASAYRVHESPSPETLKATVLPLREMGLLGGEVSAGLVAGEPSAIRAVLESAKGTTSEAMANALLLRAQKRAVYNPLNLGHYALGATAYCHFTSPIRRYPDMVIHRSLKALLDGTLGSRDQATVARRLPQLCATCSEMERTADSAARASQRVKLAELFSTKVGERFSGVVTGCTSYGVFVMLDETCAEGLVPVRALGSEWFAYDEARMTLTGEESGEVWGLGRRVAVEVTGVDVMRGRIDFAVVRRK